MQICTLSGTTTTSGNSFRLPSQAILGHLATKRVHENTQAAVFHSRNNYEGKNALGRKRNVGLLNQLYNPRTNAKDSLISREDGTLSEHQGNLGELRELAKKIRIQPM